MGVRIWEDTKSGRVVLYCSTSEWTFGPVMDSIETAKAFLAWLRIDPRQLTDKELDGKYSEFRELQVEE